MSDIEITGCYDCPNTLCPFHSPGAQTKHGEYLNPKQEPPPIHRRSNVIINHCRADSPLIIEGVLFTCTIYDYTKDLDAENLKFLELGF